MKETVKKNKETFIAGLMLITFVLVYFKRDTIKDFFSKSSNASTASTNTASTNTTSIVSIGTADTILKKGSSGEQVVRLQELLNVKHGNNKPQIIPFLVADGKFGTATESMLKKWTGKTSISINQLIKALI